MNTLRFSTGSRAQRRQSWRASWASTFVKYNPAIVATNQVHGRKGDRQRRRKQWRAVWRYVQAQRGTT